MYVTASIRYGGRISELYKIRRSEEIIIHTQGRPMSALDEVRVVDENDNDVQPGEVGSLLTRGPYTIRGYYKAEEHNAPSFTKDGFIAQAIL